jgi:aryl-alcohol dehydrogenase-like predicted oxidoreductase
MIDKQPFGRTGHLSTRTLFGGAAFYNTTDQDEADKVLDLLLQYGVNHIDTANGYQYAEARIGPWMPAHRDQFFLATKTGERTYDGAMRHLENSLKMLQTDHIDLWQMHYLVDPQEWETAMGPGGALEALIKAREEGTVSYLGVTGHDITVAQMHLRSLERFDFDTVLLPYNATMMQNPAYAADFERLMAVARERNVAVQAIKSIQRGPWGAHEERKRNTWYAPLEDQAAIDLAVHWVLANPNVFLNTVADIGLLPKVLDAASRFQPGTTQASLEPQIAALGLEPLFT